MLFRSKKIFSPFAVVAIILVMITGGNGNICATINFRRQYELFNTLCPSCLVSERYIAHMSVDTVARMSRTNKTFHQIELTS